MTDIRCEIRKIWHFGFGGDYVFVLKEKDIDTEGRDILCETLYHRG